MTEQEVGVSGWEFFRKYGVSDTSMYTWKAKYADLEVYEARQLKKLEDENSKLKMLLAEVTLDFIMLKDNLL